MSIAMFGCSLWQPHASLIVVAAIEPAKGKHIETRHWSPLKPRRLLPGLPVTLAIHASARFPGDMKDRCQYDAHFIAALRVLGIGDDDGVISRADLKRLPSRAFVAVADLVEVRESPDQLYYAYTSTELDEVERGQSHAPLLHSPEAAFGNYGTGRFMWFLENIRLLKEPLPATGRQSLWPLAPHVVEQIRERLV